MKWPTAMTIACLLALVSSPRVALCQQLSEQAFSYLVGSWEGSVAGEADAVTPRIGSLGKSKYSGTAKMTTDGKSLLQVGGWSRAGMSFGAGWARHFKLGSEPNTLVIHVYSTRADHAIVNAKVKPHGKFFEIVGEKSGVTPDGKLTAASFSLTVQDEDHFVIKNTSQTVDGVAGSDEVLEYARKQKKEE